VLADSVVAICGEGDDFTGAPPRPPLLTQYPPCQKFAAALLHVLPLESGWRVLAMQVCGLWPEAPNGGMAHGCARCALPGHMLIDDEYLRAKGLQAEDFIQYRCDPETEVRKTPSWPRSWANLNLL
jgi:hypothetical protein